MARYFLTNKWVLSSVGFLIVLAVACVLWYQHDIAPYKQEVAEAEELLRLQIAIKAADTGSETEQSTDISVDSETPTAEKPINPITDIAPENRLGPAPSDEHAQPGIPALSKKEVRKSPFGLGPYPEIPEGYPGKGTFNNSSIEHELMERVIVKMFADTGVYYSGATMDDDTGLVKLISKDRIYVSWGYANINGVPTQYISGMSAHPETGDKIRSNAKARQSETPVELRTRRRPLLLEEDIPPGVEIASHSGGIDPYEFLGLERH